MKGWQNWIEWEAFPWLADVTLQVTVIISLGLGVVMVGRHLSSAKRFRILASSLASVPVLMAAALVVPGWRMFPQTETITGVMKEQTMAFSRGATDPKAPAVSQADTSKPASSATAEKNPERSSSWKTAGLVLWVAGVLSLAFILARSAWRLRRLRREALCPPGDRVSRILAHLRAESGLPETQSVSVGLSPRNLMPMTWGIREAVILLPRESADWTDDRLRLVLRHELAHVARADSLISCLSFVFASLFWFHPLIWIATRKLWRSQESACDDRVLATSGMLPEDYASELLQTVSSLQSNAGSTMKIPAPAIAIGMASSPGRKQLIQERVAAILDDSRDRKTFGKKAGRLMIPIWLAILVALGGFSACRDNGAEETPATITDESYTTAYFLTDQQWKSLTYGSKPVNRDPFADPGAAVIEDDLSEAAVVIRTRLIEEGVPLESSGEATPTLVLQDRRNLVVRAKKATHEQIQKVLARFTDQTQIKIEARAFRIPKDLNVIEELGLTSSLNQSGMASGILQGEDFVTLLKKLGQTKGVELLSTPTVVTRSAEEATITVGRELIYPTEYDPPEIPNSVPENKDGVMGSFPVTPANPAAFEVRQIGLALEFLPILRPDGRIQLRLDLDQTEFDGFINYGSPINTSARNDTGEAVSVTLTENRIEMPVFSTSGYQSTVTLGDGEILVIGGIGSSESLNIEAKFLDQKTERKVWRGDEAKAESILFFSVRASLIE